MVVEVQEVQEGVLKEFLLPLLSLTPPMYTLPMLEFLEHREVAHLEEEHRDNLEGVQGEEEEEEIEGFRCAPGFLIIYFY